MIRKMFVALFRTYSKFLFIVEVAEEREMQLKVAFFAAKIFGTTIANFRYYSTHKKAITCTYLVTGWV